MLDVVALNLPIAMIRPDLDDIPALSFPAGFRFRWYVAGDEQLWVAIQSAADAYNEISLGLFQQEFGSDQRLLHERIFFLENPQGRAIGTAAAWFNSSYMGRPFGRVHWVAILPDFQGQGLGKPLMTIVCRRLRELGHDRAYLTTSTARIPAINLYLQFGFRPQTYEDAEADIWHRLRPYLKDPPGL